jgi:hypothetical protein
MNDSFHMLMSSVLLAYVSKFLVGYRLHVHKKKTCTSVLNSYATICIVVLMSFMWRMSRWKTFYDLKNVVIFPYHMAPWDGKHSSCGEKFSISPTPR